MSLRVGRQYHRPVGKTLGPVTSGKGHTTTKLLETLIRSCPDNPRRFQTSPDVLLKEVRLLLKRRLSDIKFVFRQSKNDKRL